MRRQLKSFVVLCLLMTIFLAIGAALTGCGRDECGNGICRADAGEYASSCPGDCLLPCDEDGICEPGEYPWNCPQDCTCGDGVCQGENCCTCADDCYYGDPVNPCQFYTIASMICGLPGCGNGGCNPPAEFCGNCPQDCGSCAEQCGDGICALEMGESCTTCPIDCHFGLPDLPCCGNTLCESNEDITTCPCDCGGDSAGCQFPPANTCNGGTVQPGEVCEDNWDCSMQFANTDLLYCVDCRCVEASCNNDGVCDEDRGESATNCLNDCAECGDGVYSPDLGEECDHSAPYEGAEELVCPFDHYCDTTCNCVAHGCFPDGTCDLLRESPASCPEDCYCGDGRVSTTWGLEECETDADCTAGEVCVDCQCEPPTGACGDGTCDMATENTDLCPDDCPCVNDRVCSPGEGDTCSDCGDAVDACGAPCGSSDECHIELSCFNAVCWDACICEGNCGQQDEGGGETCSSPCTTISDCGSDLCTCAGGCCSCP